MWLRIFNEEVRKSAEFQSAFIRILVWILMMTLMGLAGSHQIYDFNVTIYLVLFALHLVWFVAMLVHIVMHPELNTGRTYLAVLADMSGTSCSMWLSGSPISPFYLLFVWSFLSQGVRFGRNNLYLASAGSIVAFTIVVTLLDGWHRYPIEVTFMLLFLMVLPQYLYSLLKKLHKARLDAESANRARGNFLATMTHELRTPLSGVIGMAGLLNDSRLDEEQREYLESINTSARVLQSLIGDILDLSKIDAGKLELKSEQFDIRSAVVETAGALSNDALDKAVELYCEVGLDVPRLVRGDQLRLRQVLYNLVGNAIKFTEQGMVCITVETSKAGQELGVPHLLISVRDTGIGIDREKLSQIFDSFWQADSSTTRRYGGTGLGTTISRDLTHLMGGRIGVESEPNVGSRFWIRVPLLDRTAPQPPEPPEVLRGRRLLLLDSSSECAEVTVEGCRVAGMDVYPVTDLAQAAGISDAGEPDLMVISDAPRGIDMVGIADLMRGSVGADIPVLYLHYARRKMGAPDLHSASLCKPFSLVNLWQAMAGLIDPQSATPVPERGGRQPVEVEERSTRVLVAEDDNINAKLISSLLRNQGYQFTLVRDGQEAYQAATQHQFDVALIDLRMPKMDGVDFTRQYRAQELPGQRLPIVALTANAAEDARADCMAAGVDEFLTKPVDPELLFRLLEQYASR